MPGPCKGPVRTSEHAWIEKLAQRTFPQASWQPPNGALAAALCHEAGGELRARAQLGHFVHARGAEAAVVIDLLASDPRDRLLVRSEVLLALALLDAEPYGLRRAWIQAAPPNDLATLAEVWGRPY
jgi:hypothetical protein